MSRSGYCDDIDDHRQLAMWRGAVASAIRGRRGQAFLKEMLTAMDTVAGGKLITGELEEEGAVCALGSVGKARGVDMTDLDPYDYEKVPVVFGIPGALAREIMFMNDEGTYRPETPEERYVRMRKWVQETIRDQTA